MNENTDFTQMKTYRDPNLFINDYSMDAESAKELGVKIATLNHQIEMLEQGIDEKKGAAKAAVTRKTNPLKAERDALLKVYRNNAPPEPQNEAELVSVLIDQTLRVFHDAVEDLTKIQLDLAGGIGGGSEDYSFHHMEYTMRWKGESLFAATEAVRFYLDTLDREHLCNFTTIAQLHTYLVDVMKRMRNNVNRWSSSRSTSMMSNLNDDAKHSFYLDQTGDRWGGSGIKGVLLQIEYRWDRVVAYRLANPDNVTQLPRGGKKEVERLF